jgi:hypothetical protein
MQETSRAMAVGMLTILGPLKAVDHSSLIVDTVRGIWIDLRGLKKELDSASNSF